MKDIVIFDLEFTAWEGSKERDWSGENEYREVVQIGAVKIDTDTLQEKDSASIFIKPKINPKLSEYFSTLTGITQEKIDTEGVSFEEALKEFYKFAGQSHLYSWGSDPEVLEENCRLYGTGCLFSKEQFSDARDIFKKQSIDAENYSSGTITEAFGEKSSYIAHDALNDARTILLGLNKLPENPFV